MMRMSADFKISNKDLHEHHELQLCGSSSSEEDEGDKSFQKHETRLGQNDKIHIFEQKEVLKMPTLRKIQNLKLPIGKEHQTTKVFSTVKTYL